MRKTRMQILIDAEAKKMLEREAKIRNISVGQVIRDAVELYGKEKLGDEKQLTGNDPLWKMVGIVTDELSDASEEHDHYIYGTSKKIRRHKK